MIKQIALGFAALLLSFLSLNAQSKKELAASLAQDLATYNRFVTEMKIDSMLMFMPRALFEIVPQDSLVALTASSMNNEHFSIRMEELKYTAKPKIKKASSYYWALVPYDLKLVFYFKGENSMNKLMAPMMQAKFGKENVRTIEDKNAMEINMKKKNLIAFKKSNAPQWSLLEDKREEATQGSTQAILFEAAVPDEVRKALNKK
jgi:hypothetical protein